MVRGGMRGRQGGGGRQERREIPVQGPELLHHLKPPPFFKDGDGLHGHQAQAGDVNALPDAPTRATA